MKISKVLSLCLLSSTCLITACSGNARASMNHLVSGAQRDGFLALIYKKKPIKFKSSLANKRSIYKVFLNLHQIPNIYWSKG